MQRGSREAISALIPASGPPGRFIADEVSRITLDGLDCRVWIDADPAVFQGRSVLVTTRRQLPTVLAAFSLDGLAARVLLCPPDLPHQHLAAIMDDAQVDAVVTDGTGLPVPTRPGVPVWHCHGGSERGSPAGDTETEWVLFTSGTTGRPKMVRHTLQSLIGPYDTRPRTEGAVWSTFYDVRRYGGMSILVRSLLGGASLVLSSAEQSLGDFLLRAGTEGVTHISGTPSHWRRALMSPSIKALSPVNVRLSGEVADQAILDRLHAAFPKATVTHAFASTEAGVAFEVTDGLEGFPATMLDGQGVRAELRVEGDTLRIRSSRTASGYLGADLPVSGGFVDTGDVVERRGDRYYFAGRKEGVINVGGQKVYPEEVEGVINRHPAVRMSRVWSRPNPLTGALVAADIVLADDWPGDAAAFAPVRDEILQSCRDALVAYKVPVMVRKVAMLEVTESGKMVRSNA
jgi:acyl-CoA synthetase (AMP-forming)/AMP-acid ligase II